MSFSKGCVKGLNSAQFYIVAIKQFETEILFHIDFIKLCENTVILHVVILTKKCIFYLGRGMGSNDSPETCVGLCLERSDTRHHVN